MLFGGTWRVRAGLAGAMVLASACAGAPPPPPPQPESPPAASAPAEPGPIPKETVATGKDCASAEAECAGGVCAVKVKNSCEQPITCDLSIVAVCQAQTERVQARSRKRDTFAAKTDGEMSVQASCSVGDVIHTEVQEMRCE